MTTFASIDKALRKGIALTATIDTDGAVVSLPVRGVSKRGIQVWVYTDQGSFALGDWYSTGAAYRRQSVRVGSATA